MNNYKLLSITLILSVSLLGLHCYDQFITKHSTINPQLIQQQDQDRLNLQD